MGGGLGHLARSLAVINTLGIASQAHLLTASPFADDPRITAGVRVTRAPQIYIGGFDSYRLWLQKLFDKLRPDELFLDTFPAGIRGELCGFKPLRDVPIQHVARLLRWDEYQKLLSDEPPKFTHAYILERLDHRHAQFIKQQGGKKRALALQYPSTASDSSVLDVEQLKRQGRPVWLVVHSGSAREVETLLDYADAMRHVENIDAELLLIARRPPERIRQVVTLIDCYPASLLFSVVDRIISGCGFNVMRETEPFQHKHRFIPFARRFDDQFTRASRRRPDFRQHIREAAM